MKIFFPQNTQITDLFEAHDLQSTQKTLAPIDHSLFTIHYLASMIPAQQLDFCLLIPCYNNVKGLIASLKTIHYSPNLYLVVAVNDGSREEIDEKEIKLQLDREVPLVFLHHEKNLGITAALNTGLKWIKENVKTNYIARLDCGDTNEKDRFELQVDFLNHHEQIGLVGSWCRFLDPLTGKGYVYQAPAAHEELVRTMYFRNAFIHPTIMFRKELLDSAGFYPETFVHAEDYAFCWSLMQIKQSFVFQKVLVVTEINKGGLSFSNKGKQLKARWKVVKTYGRSKTLKIIGLIRICLLFLFPKQLILRLKEMRGDGSKRATIH